MFVNSANNSSRRVFARASALIAAAGSLFASLASRCNTSCVRTDQTFVAVQPVTRRLIAAGNCIHKIEGWITANDVPCRKCVRLNHNL